MSLRERVQNAMNLYRTGERPAKTGSYYEWHIVDERSGEPFPVKIIWALANNIIRTKEFRGAEARRALKEAGFLLRKRPAASKSSGRTNSDEGGNPSHQEQTPISVGKDITGPKSRRSPIWIRDELILALELYLSNRSSPPGPTSPEIIALSELLNRLGAVLGRPIGAIYRNPNGVSMKVLNFRSLDPAFTSAGKVGLAHRSQEDARVWEEFAGAPEKLQGAAEAVRAAIQSSLADQPLSPVPIDEDMEDAPEGRLLTVNHLRRERSRKLIEKRKEKAFKELGKIECEACGLNFGERYGERGEGFIEVHHTKPVSTLREGDKTKLTDLALVCSNCHRIIHRRQPWLALDELKAILGRL